MDIEINPAFTSKVDSERLRRVTLRTLVQLRPFQKNRRPKSCRFPWRFGRRTAARFLEWLFFWNSHGQADAAQLTVIVTDDDRIRELNHQFRGVDAPTDVLAFHAAGEGEQFVTAPEATAYLGDIVVSYPRAAVQAEEVGHSIFDELDLLVVHGVLHLLGWKDDTEEARARMWSKQQDILSGGQGF